jgi:hypothetical protein
VREETPLVQCLLEVVLGGENDAPQGRSAARLILLCARWEIHKQDRRTQATDQNYAT